MHKIRVVCISDTHTQHRSIKLPKGDVLLHSGDATYRGYKHEVEPFGVWFDNPEFQYKIFVAGNHDTSFEDTPKQAREWFYQGKQPGEGGLYYLQDELIEIEVDGIKLKVYGSPWQPEFFSWAFNLPRGEAIKAKWDMIPKGTDILITHGPPYKLSDQVTRTGEHVGCRDLRAAIQRVQPKLHVCGHIHEGYGTSRFGNTIIANASICTAGYRPTNQPLVFDFYEDGTMQKASEIQGETSSEEQLRELREVVLESTHKDPDTDS